MTPRCTTAMTALFAAGLLGCGHVRGGGKGGADPRDLDPGETSSPTPIATATATSNPTASVSPPLTCPSPAAGRMAREGALTGAGVVLRVWGTFCFIGGPLTLFICVVGFPEYGPIALGAVGLGAGIGAAAGNARAGRVPCPAPPPPEGPAPAATGPAESVGSAAPPPDLPAPPSAGPTEG